jgi:hypothetical protein
LGLTDGLGTLKKRKNILSSGIEPGLSCPSVYRLSYILPSLISTGSFRRLIPVKWNTVVDINRVVKNTLLV